jgi:RimJ/RimL family protein N-acetyltransferase
MSMIEQLDEIKIETTRLILREFVAGDFSAVHNYASDPNVARFMVWGPNSEQDTHEFLNNVIEWQKAQPRRVFDFAVVLKQGSGLIGSCGFHIAPTVSEGSSQSIWAKAALDFDAKHPYVYARDKHAALGYCFHKDAWGHGYASEAATGALRFGFETLKLHKIFATCDVENKGSARVLEKIGMHKEGHLIEDIKIKGRWRDSFLYAITINEWNPID